MEHPWAGTEIDIGDGGRQGRSDLAAEVEIPRTVETQGGGTIGQAPGIGPCGPKDRAGIVFEDLFDLDEIQHLQDQFSAASGVASLITRPDGEPITRPSNFSRLCGDVVQGTPTGLANCLRSNRAIAMPNPDGPVIHVCLGCGLWDAGVGISVAGQHVANWVIGQVRSDASTEERVRAYAREIGADEAAAAKAFAEVPEMPRVHFETIANALYAFVSRLSQSAFQNLELRKAREQITRMKDVYAALSQTNQCIVRVSDQAELFRTICRVAVEFGHFHVAWIGRVDEASLCIHPAEWAGAGDFLDDIRISADPASPYSGGPTGRAAITGESQIFNDVASLPEIMPWRQRCADAGVKSMAAFPLLVRGQVTGTLTLYSTVRDFFASEFIALLTEMAADISHALERMEAEEEHRQLRREFIASQTRTQAMLKESYDLLYNLTAQVPALIFQFRRHPDGRSSFPFMSEAFRHWYGVSPEDLRNDASLMLKCLHPDDAPAVFAGLERSAETLEPWRTEYRVVLPGWGTRWRMGEARPQRQEDGGILWHGFIVDVSDRKEAQDRIEFLTYHDPLTGLPNRVLGKDRVERAISNAERLGGKAAILVINVDHFKKINDSLGLSTADALLKTLADRLRGCLRETDTLCRLGSDEFLVVLAAVKDPESINRVAAKILKQVDMPVATGQGEISVTASIGVAFFPEDGRDVDTLLRHAGTAMRHAKEAGRNTYRFFADRMNVDADEYLMLSSGLRRALDLGEFVLYYQPQIALDDNRVVGAEALIRWNHPTLGMIPPGKFIPIAEEGGQIVEIGHWVLHEACRQAAAWHRAGLGCPFVAVNLSAVQFKQGGLLDSVRSALASSGLDPRFLELELTETTLIRDTGDVLATVKRLKALGVKLSIDDFGTGYSSLAYLRLLEVDKLKIDQSLVRDITASRDNDMIVKAIVQLAQGLGLKTIAEGVETAAMLNAVRRHGCDEVQGYFFSKPVPLEDFVAFVSAWE